MLYEVNDIRKIKIFRPGTDLSTWYNNQSDKPDYLLNASLYNSPSNPIGTIIEGGKMVKDAGNGFGFGIKSDGSWGFGNPWNAWVDYISGYYGIVQIGKAIDPPWTDNYVFGSSSVRIGIGERNGKLCILTSDSSCKITAFRDWCVSQNMENVINLDGGGSRHLVANEKLIHKSTRTPYNAIAIWCEKDKPSEEESTVKICLDAGHYGNYNQSPAVKTYYESKAMWTLHLYLKSALEEYGIEVITTRSDQTKDMELTDRGKKAKGCNLFISLHSNAVGSSVNESVDYPVVYRPISGKAKDIAEKLAACVQFTMGTKQEARTNIRYNSSNTADYYGVIRGAASVGVAGLIIEHSFHTNTKMTNWLLQDANLKKMAEAEAKVIADCYGLKKQEAGTLYKVQVGAFSKKANADALAAELKSKGYQTYIVQA